ncbi:type II toxin-antitoxin system RelE/ParE family toxin [Propionimicrobium sp. PCR01-08-3]|uniref:type II toxin-antitoxin system RelE/ParE family toxin n=1 Tax=Propionimicrobium sp. PCR01-08-3 TaxID=3052086 RepID=UPI00255CBFA9|nr:type II toxin-antitoxin system RelE/ParE family toxin [Propionimicrobium sp. PCR01-08-3]WIY81942.1 type II toxin-antitoxin system RelE/ParE family toxin [Propionimicrobium sp. PCR01-08-3]
MNHVRDTHAKATAELIEAAKWYESRQFGLGDDFLESVEGAVSLILEWPQIAPVFPGWDREPVVRTQAVARFPYRVLYYLTESKLMVVAFAHNRRKPGYWEDRL